MKQEHIEELEYLCRLYGVYEVAKVVKNIAVTRSEEFAHHGNQDAIVRKDAYHLTSACNLMALSHPLRYLDVPK